MQATRQPARGALRWEALNVFFARTFQRRHPRLAATVELRSAECRKLLVGRKRWLDISQLTSLQVCRLAGKLPGCCAAPPKPPRLMLDLRNVELRLETVFVAPTHSASSCKALLASLRASKKPLHSIEARNLGFMAPTYKIK